MSRRHPFLLTTLFFLSTLSHNSTRAETDWVSVVWQNDIFAGSDGGGYTNGVFISLYDLSTEGNTTYGAPFLAKALGWMLNKESGLRFSEQVLGQVMVTPLDISRSVPDPNDAPYAGLLFYRASDTVVKDHFADMVSTTIGLVGPDSGAERAQKWVHEVTGSENPQGWRYQLRNEPVFALSRTGIWRHDLWHWADAVVIGKGQLGNLESALTFGAVIRIGRGLSESYATTALSYGRINSPVAVNHGWNVYLGANANYVANYIFVDGNSYRASQSSDLKHHQYNTMSGFSYSWTNVSLTFSYSSGTPIDKKESARHSFGALSLAWRL